VPPPHGLGSRVEWRGLFKRCLSVVWPCQFDVPAGSPVDPVRTGAHGSRALVPPPHGLGSRVERRGLFKLRFSGVLLFRFGLFIRAGAHGSRTGLPPPVLGASHANRAENQHDRYAKTEKEMFHRCVTSMRSSGPPLELDWLVATVRNFPNVAGCVAALFYGTVRSCRGRVSAPLHLLPKGTKRFTSGV